MIGIIGKKLGMTQVFNDQGQQIPVTVVEAPPNPVAEGDGQGRGGLRGRGARVWAAADGARVEEGRGEAARTSREPRRDRPREEGGARLCAEACCGRSGSTTRRARTRRSRPTSVGDVVNVGVFAVGDQVKVTGTSKGRGFQGIVKRHKAGGGPNTHGNTKHRRPGLHRSGHGSVARHQGQGDAGAVRQHAAHADAPSRSRRSMPSAI